MEKYEKYEIKDFLLNPAGLITFNRPQREKDLRLINLAIGL